MQVLDFFLLMQVAAAGGERQHPLTTTLLLHSLFHLKGWNTGSGSVTDSWWAHWGEAWGQLITTQRRKPQGVRPYSSSQLHFPFAGSKAGSRTEKEVREGAEGNLFPVSLLQATVVGLGGGWRAGVGTIKALSGKSCCFICLQEWTNHGPVSMNQIPSLWKCSAKLEILGCTTPRT